jgi:thymidylate synthase
MRLFMNPAEALSEIRRDLYKGPKVTSTRVQNRTDQQLPGRELLLYSYAIENNHWPENGKGVVDLALKLKLDFYSKPGIANWLDTESVGRLAEVIGETSDHLHPALCQTFEGNWPSYTYGERLHGAQAALLMSLRASPDSRRAFWPIFRMEDSFRASAPTRVPCSLGYQTLIRNTPEGPRLLLIYFQRSADFDTFFWSDIWFAHKFQRSLCYHMRDIIEDLEVGQLMHVISSLHSFTVENTEIY